MTAILASAVLAAIIGLFITAHALPAVKGIVIGWTWLYSAPAPEEEREGRRAEVKSHVFEFTYAPREPSDTSGDTAVRLFESWVKGLPSDIAWCAPVIPACLVDKITGWSDSLRHCRVPTAMIVGVATLGSMNYALFSSPNSQSFGPWLFANTLGIAATVLVWKHKHPLARRILHAWMGISIAAGLILIVWLTVQYHFYNSLTFKTLMLAVAAVLPTIIVVDKPRRNRLFKGRWWLIAVCWAPIIAGSCIGSLLVAHSVMPLLEMWAAMAVLAISMAIVYGAVAFGAYVLCLLGIRGSARGLRLVASGIRHMR